MRRLPLLLLLLLATLLATPLTACLSTGLGDVTLIEDIAYGEDDDQVFDVYRLPTTEDAPVIFIVHGGAWKIGDKANKGVVANKVARWVNAGFVVVSTNYRMLPEAGVETQLKDVTGALVFAQAHAKEWGGNREQFILMGHSAGAHLIALVSAAPEHALKQKATPWLGSVILDSAAMDVVAVMKKRHYGFFDDVFGEDEAFWRAHSPAHVLTAKAMPMLLVCSSRREDSLGQSKAFVAKATKLGVRAVVSAQDLSHRDINRQLGVEGDYTDAVEGFMASLNPHVEAVLEGDTEPGPPPF